MCRYLPIYCAPRFIGLTVAEDEIRQNDALACTMPMPMPATSITQNSIILFPLYSNYFAPFCSAQLKMDWKRCILFALNRLFFNQIQIQAFTQRRKTPIIIITYFPVFFFLSFILSFVALLFCCINFYFIVADWWAHFFFVVSHFEKWIS